MKNVQFTNTLNLPKNDGRPGFLAIFREISFVLVPRDVRLS